jgi:hypothetical protein
MVIKFPSKRSKEVNVGVMFNVIVSVPEEWTDREIEQAVCDEVGDVVDRIDGVKSAVIPVAEIQEE